MFWKSTLFLSLLPLVSGYADLGHAERSFRSGGDRIDRYLRVASNLVEGGFYYAATPFVKEYLAHDRKDSVQLNQTLDKLIAAVGIKQFEVLPHNFLKNSSGPIIQYVRAKKYFRKGDYLGALKLLNRNIKWGKSTRAHMLLLKASILTIKKKYDLAIETYQSCIDVAGSAMQDTTSKNRAKQIEIVRDNCVIGIPRAYFAARNFKQANLSYMDLPKSSYIWPNILFEEAWVSFYLTDYNRTLGKLVTYKAPVLKHIVGPEHDVLRAFSYLKLCLWEDVIKEVDNYYAKYQEYSFRIRKKLQERGHNYKYYYKLAQALHKNGIVESRIYNPLLKNVIKDPAFIELMDSLKLGLLEMEKIATSGTPLRKILSRNIERTLLLQRNIIGSFVRKSILLNYAKIHYGFEKMSYLKLEGLRHRKNSLYIKKGAKRSRGDFVYLKRNDRQYLWTFNGEFWADELGDYVFALRSECDL